MTTSSRRAVAALTLSAAFGLAAAPSAQAGLLPSSSLISALEPVASSVGVPTTQLTAAVTTLMQAGVPAEATALAPLIQQAVAAPTSTVSLEQLISGLLAQGVTPTAVNSLVQQVVAQIGATSVDPAALGRAIVAQVLARVLPSDTALLTSVVVALQADVPPTGSLLAPVASILDTIAASEVLPADLRASAATLAGQLRSAGDTRVPDDVLAQVGGLLSAISTSSSAPAPVKGQMSDLAVALVWPSSTGARPGTSGGGTRGRLPAAVAGVKRRDLTAKLSSVRVDRSRRIVRARISCPKRSPVGCTTRTIASLDGLRTGAGRRLVLRPGTVRTVTVTISRRAQRKLKRRGGRVVLRTTTSYAGHHLGRSAKQLRVKRAASGRRASARVRARR